MPMANDNLPGGVDAIGRDASENDTTAHQDRPLSVSAPRSSGNAATREHGRGRSATKPSDIPAPGWKDILLRVYQGIADDRILANAAAVVFFALLALFPGIAALVSIYGLFADASTISQHLDSLSGVLPGGAVDVIRDQLIRLNAEGNATLGIILVVGL